MRRAEAAVAALMWLASACGARTPLEVGGAERPDAGPHDARLDAPAPDGGIAITCDGHELPRVLGVETSTVPPRRLAGGTVVPDPHALIATGGSDATAPATTMWYLDLASSEAGELRVVGDDVELPDRDAAAVYVADGDRVLVIGGRAGEAQVPTAETFQITGEGDPSGERYVRARRHTSFPDGPLAGHVAVLDPVGHRIIVHGGSDGAGETHGATWAFELDMGPTWFPLLPAEESPPSRTYAIGYDPRGRRAIEIAADDDGLHPAVWALSLERGAERWQRLAEVDFVPSTRGELVWDESACGFHILSARRTRCTLEHWTLVVDDRSAVLALDGDVAIDRPQFLASSIFVPSRREILLFGGELCESSEPAPSALVQRIAL